MSQTTPASAAKRPTERAPRLPQDMLDARRELAITLIAAGKTNLDIEAETKARYGTKIDNGAIAKLRKTHRRKKARKSAHAQQPKMTGDIPPGPLNLAAQYMRNAMQAAGIDVVTLNAKTNQLLTSVQTDVVWDIGK